MTTRTKLIAHLSTLMHEKPDLLTRYGTQLAEANLIPSGGRGKYAPSMEPLYAARILIAYGSSTVKEVKTRCRMYEKMPVLEADPHTARNWFQGDEPPMNTLIGWLEFVLDSPSRAEQVESLTVCRNRREASLRSRDGLEIRFGHQNPENDKPLYRMDFVFEGELLRKTTQILKENP